MEPETLDFEAAFARLEEIVGKLESDDLAIDQAVKLYELGVRLMRHCSSRLDEAELRIKQLTTSSDGDLSVVPIPYPS